MSGRVASGLPETVLQGRNSKVESFFSSVHRGMDRCWLGRCSGGTSVSLSPPYTQTQGVGAREEEERKQPLPSLLQSALTEKEKKRGKELFALLKKQVRSRKGRPERFAELSGESFPDHFYVVMPLLCSTSCNN